MPLRGDGAETAGGLRRPAVPGHSRGGVGPALLRYGSLPRLLDAALKANAHAEVKGLLQSIVDVVLWHERPTNLREGWADIRLWEIPPGVLSAQGTKTAQPCDPPLDGSQGCDTWLLGRDSNPRPSG